MSRAISVDLRERALRMVKAGASRRAAALHFGVGVSSVIRWVERERVRGDVRPDKPGGDRRSHRIDAHRDLIMSWIEAEPDLTLAEIAERLEKQAGCRAVPSMVCRFFQRHGVTRKKRPRTRRSRAAGT